MSSPSDNLNGGDTAGLATDLDRLASEYQNIDVTENEPLSRHSSMRVGGSARWWIEAGEREGLKAILEAARRADVAVHPVGLGSNVLFPDNGIDGVVLRLTGEFDGWEVIDERQGTAEVRVGDGTVNAHLVRGLLDAGWTGLEFLNLVPGTFGGAVALNAGTKEAELSERLVSVEWCRRLSNDDGREDDRDDWEFERVDAESLSMSYRYAEVPDDAVVVSGVVRVVDADVESARERMEADRSRRDATQPYKLASSGSTFANPPDDYAGRLIDEAGLKGRRVGGAKISEHHANFFINDKDATTRDIISLMALARKRVRDAYGIELRPEVRFVGFDGMKMMSKLERQWREDGDHRTSPRATG